jgi:hypothetical protein
MYLSSTKAQDSNQKVVFFNRPENAEKLPKIGGVTLKLQRERGFCGLFSVLWFALLFLPKA